MKNLWRIIGWIFTVLFGMLTVSMLLTKNWPAAFVLFVVVMLCLPPFSAFVRKQYKGKYYPVMRLVMIAGLLVVYGRLLMGSEATSIYSSPAVEARFHEMYDEKMRDWPVAYEDIMMDTRYGQVHVIVCGSEHAPPMLLLHASGVAGWSWKYNAEELSARYRLYAVDLIGDAGKSTFASLDTVMKTGRDQADLYKEITDGLGVQSAYVVGASEGGFIGTNYAFHYPGRVKKLVLLGPMGYSGALGSIIRITLAQLFPLKPIQESTFTWVFSTNEALKQEFSEWFPLFMRETYPVKVAPMPFSPETRQQISVPVLFVFGTRDNLVGDPEKAKQRVQDMPDVRVRIIDAGHLMGAEKPLEVNQCITEFCR